MTSTLYSLSLKDYDDLIKVLCQVASHAETLDYKIYLLVRL